MIAIDGLDIKYGIQSRLCWKRIQNTNLNVGAILELINSYVRIIQCKVKIHFVSIFWYSAQRIPKFKDLQFRRKNEHLTSFDNKMYRKL